MPHDILRTLTESQADGVKFPPGLITTLMTLPDDHLIRTLFQCRAAILDIILRLQNADDRQLLKDADQQWECFGRTEFVEDAKPLLDNKRLQHFIEKIEGTENPYSEYRKHLSCDIELALGVFVFDQLTKASCTASAE